MTYTKINKNKLVLLLEKLKILHYKYEKLESANSFNIFSILSKKHDEVNLHSRFIAEILHPFGAHNFSNKFLKAFVEQLGVKGFEFEGTVVETEYRKIDILIKNTETKQAIIIENKIYANDQERQLERYNELIKGEGYKIEGIYYLTLDGREANEKSIGKLDKENVITLSYKEDVLKWVERCIEISALTPSIREVLSQYKKLIEDLTNQSYMEEHIKDLMELLEENDNAKQAKTLVDNWEKIKWHTEYMFWSELENELKEKYKILDEQKWSVRHLDRAHYYYRNRSIWFGLMFEIFKINDYSIRVFIERGDANLYYGLILFEKGNRIKVRSEGESLFSFSKKIEDLCEERHWDFWLGLNYFKPFLNFEKFNSKATEVINPIKRKELIIQFQETINDFVSRCEEKLSEG